MKTKKERSIHELLKLLLSKYYKGYVHLHHSYSLCLTASRMRSEGEITFSEYMKLDNYIDLHPSIWFKLGITIPFYWKIGRIEPRIRWIKRHIKKTKP